MEKNKIYLAFIIVLCCLGCSEDPNTFIDDTETDTGVSDTGPHAGIDDTETDTGVSDTGPHAGIDDTETDTGVSDTETEAGIQDTETETVINDTGGDCQELEPGEGVTIGNNKCVYIPVQSDYNGRDLVINVAGIASQNLVFVWLTCEADQKTAVNTYLNISQGKTSIMTFDEYSSNCDIVLDFIGSGIYFNFSYTIEET